jgi:hypothetical protein
MSPRLILSERSNNLFTAKRLHNKAGGAREWQELSSLADLVQEGRRFQPMIPHFQPHFLNLPTLSPDELVTKGGFFGNVLRLLQQQHVDEESFRSLLEQVVKQLEDMPERDSRRWQEFLSWIQALVYHARTGDQRHRLRQVIEASARNEAHRKELGKMSETIAELLKREGREEQEIVSLQSILLRQLRKRFKKLPRKLEARINATTSVAELQTWLDNFVDAQTLAEVGVPID